jgi:hypothetical protein
VKLLFIFLFTVTCVYSGDIKVLPPDNGIYHTAFSTMYSEHDKVSEMEVPYFENLTGKKIVWLNFSNNWFDGIKFPVESVRNIYKHGVIPNIRIMPWGSYSSRDTKYPLRKIIRGDFDDEFKKWADDLKSTGIPVMIEFAPEPNGDWFPWCGVCNGGAATDSYGDKKIPDGPEIWIDAYRHIVNLFRQNRVRNVTWVFHVNAVGSPDELWNSIKNYYPGDEYVDWLGLSAYGPQRWGESYIHFIDVLRDAYYALDELSDSKPIAVLEFGVADYLPDISKPNWIQDALYTVQTPEFHRIKAIGWWHSTWWNSDGTISAIQIDSSPESLRFYRDAIAQPVFVDRCILGK